MTFNLFLTNIVSLVLLSTTLCLDEVTPPLLANYSEKFDLVCSSIDLGIEIKWEKNNATITADNKLYDIIDANNTLRVLKVDEATVGEFVCSGKNHSQVLTLHARPYVNQFEKEKNVIESDPLTVLCSAWGYPKPIITWYKGSTELFPGDLDGRVTFNNGTPGNQAGSFPVLVNGTLRITDIKFDIDNGTYLCFATYGSDSSNATIQVNVKSKYAALWPFLGICAEVAILCTIILIYEKRRTKRLEAEESREEEAVHLNANNDTKASADATEDVRQRK